MNTLTLVALSTGFAAIIAFVWLDIRAFGRHSGWGMAVLLFSPVSAVAFGIRYWRDVWTPFLAYLVFTATATALCLHLFATWGGWELLRASQQVYQNITSHTLTESDTQSLITISKKFDERSGLDMQSSNLLLRAQRELDVQAMKLAAKKATAERKIIDIGSMTRKVKPAQSRYRLSYVTINIKDAPNYVGSTVKVTRKNVTEKEYRLISASNSRLEFSQRVGSGSYKFKYYHSDIEKIRVLTKQPY